MEKLDYRELLKFHRKNTIKFSEFIDSFLEDPTEYLHTSASLISQAIKYFGFEITVRSGEPIINYNIFKDLFSSGVDAVFGQEFSIKHILDVIESAEKEAGPNRGIVLVGPPASGKTNIVDLITRAVEEYTKQKTIKLYSFLFQFTAPDGHTVEVRSNFRHNPILLFPTVLKKDDGTVIRPRQELFEHVNAQRPKHQQFPIPTYYQHATLDKRTLDVVEALFQNPRNRGKSLFDILEEYVQIEEIEFSNPQANGISNIDDMTQLRVLVRHTDLGQDSITALNEHLPGQSLCHYEGAMVDANRGILHIHDAFGVNGEGIGEAAYKPLLMLLGSGKVSVESTQSSIDTTVVLTTNIEEMDILERQLTSAKLLDRIEKIPVNYLLDANAEMDILKRDMANMRRKYDVDPNLLRIAAYYSVATRLLSPVTEKLPPDWSDEKKALYHSITPEQKLYIFSAQAEDPVGTIKKLPHWHPFHNEALRLGLNLYDADSYAQHIVKHPQAVSLNNSSLFTNEQLRLIDDEFMRVLHNEHHPNEGRQGMSVRQLQNIMRNTIANSDGRRVHVGIFLSQLKRIILEGPKLHRWLALDVQDKKKKGRVIAPRKIGNFALQEGEGDYGDFRGLVTVVQAIYYMIIHQEITVATVDRDPEKIELDFRRYLQHALLAKAIHNKAFSHIMIPRFTFIDPISGEKVEEPDLNYMSSIEKILTPDGDPILFRQEIAQKFLDFMSSGELVLERGKTLVTSSSDNFLACFSKEYALLLSHRRTDDSIDPELLRNAFFHKVHAPEQYEHYTPETRQFVENIITNMAERYGYSRTLALNTVVFALRKNIIDFSKILS